jgi:hypothetical protein
VNGAAGAALARGIQRTMALIGGRTFTARGPRTRLHVAATISANVVHDGLHGDVFAVSGATGDGAAFFALPVGRRIDLRVTAR